MPPLQLITASAGATQAAGGQVATAWHVPSVVGQPVDAVRRTLTPYRLQVVQQPVYSDRPVDEVVATDPPPGATAPEGSRLVLKVSVGLPAGPVDVGQQLVALNRQVGVLTERMGKRDVGVVVAAGVLAGVVAAVAVRAGSGAPTGSGGGGSGGGGTGGGAGGAGGGTGESYPGGTADLTGEVPGATSDPVDTGGGTAGGKGSGSRGGRSATTSSA